MHYYFEVLKKYAVFSGRATRAEYWYFVLFNFIFYVAITILSGVIFLASGVNTVVLLWIYILAVFIPGLAVAVRRLHDTGRSGWWLLLNLIPLIGAIIVIVLLVLDSQPGENKYGPNPKELATV